MLKKDDLLIEYINYSWRKWVVFDRKYKSDDCIYWENSIYKDEKLIFRTIEKSDRKKDFSILHQELMSYLL